MNISLLGSTGSIGQQTLDIVARHPGLFSVTSLSAYRDSETLFRQVAKFRPKVASLAIEPESIPEELRFCEWLFGEDAIVHIARHCPADSLLVAVVGAAGLEATLAGIHAGKRILLANKETLVTGGPLVMEEARRAGVPLLPVDSEHSAILQCLEGAGDNPVAKIHLCASGGPFLHTPKAAMDAAHREQALAHPNWSMGAKITVDSATMMNKGLEFIEAHYLFDVPLSRIEVLIQPQSIIHSMVEFEDGSVIAQLAQPDMRLPIAYALHYPRRLDADIARMDFAALGRLDFYAPDTEKFRCLALALEALRQGGGAPVVLNAANEVAVEAFLRDAIPLGAISALVEEALSDVRGPAETLEEIKALDEEARVLTKRLLSRLSL